MTKFCPNLWGRFRGPKYFSLLNSLPHFIWFVVSVYLGKGKLWFLGMETQLLAKREEKQPCLINCGMIREPHCLVQQSVLNYVMQFIAKPMVSSLNFSRRMEEYWEPAPISSSTYVWQTQSGSCDLHLLLATPLHNSLCLSASASSNLLQTTRVWQRWWDVSDCMYTVILHEIVILSF